MEIITNEVIANAICGATANDDMVAQWANQNSQASAVGFHSLHEPFLIDAIRAHPQRLMDAPAAGVALLFSFASFDALLPIVKIGLRDPHFITALIDRLTVASELDGSTSDSPEELLWKKISTRAVTRLSALQTLDLLRSVHATTTPLMADLAKRMPVTFQATHITT